MEGLLIMCFTALCTLLALCFLKYSAAKGKAKLPPGPWTLPIIGSLHHVISKVPHRKMLELSGRYGPVMFLKLGEIPTVVVSSAEAASLMLKSDIAFSDRTRSVTFNIFSCNGKDIAIAPYGDHWRQMRKIRVMELLSSKQVRRKEDIRADMVHDLIRSITACLDGATVNVTLSAGSSLVDLFPSSQLVRWFSKGEREVRRCYDGIQRIIADIVDEPKATRDTSDGISSEDDEDLLGALLRLQAAAGGQIL